MKTTAWFNYREHMPVHEGRYQVTTGDINEKDVANFAEKRPFYWHWRRGTWYIENPGRRPFQPEWTFKHLYWRGVKDKLGED